MSDSDSLDAVYLMQSTVCHLDVLGSCYVYMFTYYIQVFRFICYHIERRERGRRLRLKILLVLFQILSFIFSHAIIMMLSDFNEHSNADFHPKHVTSTYVIFYSIFKKMVVISKLYFWKSGLISVICTSIYNKGYNIYCYLQQAAIEHVIKRLLLSQLHAEPRASKPQNALSRHQNMLIIVRPK